MEKLKKILNINFEKIRGKDRNLVTKIIIGYIIFSILISIISMFVHLSGITRIIVITIIALIQISAVVCIFLIMKRKKKQSIDNFEVKYDPILTYYMKENKIECTENLIFAELMDLARRGYVEIKEENGDTIYILKEKDKFIRMNGLENIDRKQMQEYSTDEIPAYENLFVTRLLFPFENKITKRDIYKKIKENFYKDRMELCIFIFEKMIVFSLEEKKMITSGNSINMFSISIIINILVVLIEFAMLSSWNIFLILSLILTILLNAILLRVEKIFSYSFTEDVDVYMEQLVNYISNLVDKSKEEISEKDEILLTLFKNS